jgi:hypothetical protein
VHREREGERERERGGEREREREKKVGGGLVKDTNVLEGGVIET